MLRVFGGARVKAYSQTRSLNALDEVTQIQDAMAAVTHIMDDDVNRAEDHLSKGNSPFHLLGKGVVAFIRATLGFEQDIMREASEALSVAENAAYEQQRQAQSASKAYQSPIYPLGTEYGVCLAEAQLMSAVVGVLNESLSEAIKSFYKLRKAYLALEGIMDCERTYLKKRSTRSLNAAGSFTSSGSASRVSAQVLDNPLAPKSRTPEVKSPVKFTTNINSEDIGKSKELGMENEKPAGKGDEEHDFDFVEADEYHHDMETPSEYMGHLESKSVSPTSNKTDIRIKASAVSNLPVGSTADLRVSDTIGNFEQLTLTNTVKEGEALFGEHPIDMFINSGSNLCFGILLLIISLVPPAFATLLKIVGFKGDRERGIQMLWQATQFHNIHGAMAGLVLFGFYNGLHEFCDIVPTRGEGSNPKAKCKDLLNDMRERYPGSHLWLIEEARMLAGEKQLEKAVNILKIMSESPLQQLEALRWFERSLDSMYLHEYEDTIVAFQKSITLNNWSHGLYYYICGAAHVEIYRRLKGSNPEEADKQKEKAQTLFMQVAPNTGKKRFMARQLPFDIFVNRKIQKWEARAKDWGCNMIDAVGVSPLEEMIYFWNGYKRMRIDHLQISLDNLAWSESSVNTFWEKESLDERSILYLLRAAVLRNMDRTREAKEILTEHILVKDRALFKGHLKDSWTAPCARYEMAANWWREADADGQPEQHPEKINECKRWLDEVSKWETYDLDARIGTKIATAKVTLRRYEV